MTLKFSKNARLQTFVDRFGTRFLGANETMERNVKTLDFVSHPQQKMGEKRDER